MGISEATYYVWKKRYADLGVLELRELRQLRDENARLKRLVADLTLDRHVLQEVIKKMYDPPRVCKDLLPRSAALGLRKCIRPVDEAFSRLWPRWEIRARQAF